ncbi:hypothetical protein PQR63_14150 [Herbaspirillum rhizosphaerae]|uniref:DUF2946 domain-containing protein n=1 Tax=Herbaspirillum rhizosphaerae TaxID=346179 RepID=A0ABW8Z932_9BURK
MKSSSLITDFLFTRQQSISRSKNIHQSIPPIAYFGFECIPNKYGYNCRAMRRYLIIFLLLLLPLQFSWAAVASYCQHETESSTQHIGHHAADAGSKQDQTPGKKLSESDDADCGFCHFSCSKPMNSHAAWQPAAQDKNSFIPSLPLLYLSHIGESPEEPDWTLAA